MHTESVPVKIKKSNNCVSLLDSGIYLGKRTSGGVLLVLLLLLLKNSHIIITIIM